MVKGMGWLKNLKKKHTIKFIERHRSVFLIYSKDLRTMA